MRDCCHQKSISSIIVALLSLPMSNFVAHGQQGTPAEPIDVETKMEFALRGQREAHAIKYGDWRKFCFQTPGAKTVCRTTISGKWETGQSAVRVDFIEREGEDAARLQLFLPVGLYLQAAARLTVDQGKPFRIPPRARPARCCPSIRQPCWGRRPVRGRSMLARPTASAACNRECDAPGSRQTRSPRFSRQCRACLPVREYRPNKPARCVMSVA